MTILLSEAPAGLERPVEPLTNHLLARVGSSALSRLRSEMETVDLTAGGQLYAAGWMNDRVYFPQTAVISHIHNAESGESVEIAMIGREGASGLCKLSEKQAPLHAAVVSFGGTAVTVGVDALISEIKRNSILQGVLFDYAVEQLFYVAQRVICESFHFAEARLCSWLLMLHDRVGTSRMRITHEEISAFIGVNRSSVSVIAKKLRDRGLINYSRGNVTIIDRPALERIACECHSTVQDNVATNASRFASTFRPASQNKNVMRSTSEFKHLPNTSF